MESVRVLARCCVVLVATVRLSTAYQEIGDMMLTNSQRRLFSPLTSSRGGGFFSALRQSRYRWQRNNLPYAIALTVTDRDRAVVERAIARMNEMLYPCIRLRPATESDHDRVLVVRGADGDCRSWVGRLGGVQTLTLGDGCYDQRTVMHEFMHALGYYHEHSRPDRDDYVALHPENMQSGTERQFDKCEGCVTLGVGYDLRSIMQYPNVAFSKNGRSTITSKDSSVSSSELGSAEELSPKDVLKLKRMYRCDLAEPIPRSTCSSDGCPVDDLRVSGVLPSASKNCFFRCSHVRQGDYRRAHMAGSGVLCLDAGTIMPQYSYCCSSREVPGGISRC